MKTYNVIYIYIYIYIYIFKRLTAHAAHPGGLSVVFSGLQATQFYPASARDCSARAGCVSTSFVEDCKAVGCGFGCLLSATTQCHSQHHISWSLQCLV